MAAKHYTLDILNQAQGPFAPSELESLSGEHEEILVYDGGTGGWRPISDFAPRAARIREQGGKLAIVGEDHWARHLRRR